MSKRSTQLPKAPSHLTPDTQRWWDVVVEEYALEEHHLRLLQAAAESWDRCQTARAVLDAKGLTFMDRFGQPKPRPEAQIERDSRIAFARMLRELGLDAAPNEVRPPAPSKNAHLRIAR